jgi:lipoprotein-anchoring transpeptidase ErfK/SrfK
MKLDTDTKLIIGGAVVLLIAGFYASKKLVDVAEQALPYINPADSNNLVNQGVTAVGSWITDNPNWTLGGSIYDATHGGSLDWGGVVNPTSTNNVIYRAYNAYGSLIHGDPNWTLGGWLYDITH